MREILFRGKNIYSNKWIYGDLIQYKSGEYAIFGDKLSRYGSECSEMCKRSQIEKSTIGQFTGLTDKNGNKIFEGDIIKYQVFSNWKKKCGLDDARNIGIVFYNTDKASFYIRMVKKVFVSDYYYIGENDPLSITCALWGLEVIGNIYDNPELLK